MLVLDTFIKVDPFKSLTENDAIVCAKLFEPATVFFLWGKSAFLKEMAKIKKMADVGWPSRADYTG